MDKIKVNVNWILIFVIFLMYIAGIILYPQLPNMIPSHWNISGQVDGYTPKNIYLVFIPTLTLFIYIMLLLAPRLDPKAENYKKFIGVYNGFNVVMVLFMAGLYFITLLFAMGISISISKFIRFIIGIMLLFIGNYFGKIRHNYTFGIKTPWTLASEKVWNKTHRISGPLWVVVGLVWMLSIFFAERTAFIIDMFALILVSLFGTIYSYILFKKLENK